MTDTSRARRAPKGASKAQGALAKLAALRNGGKRGSRLDSSDEEEDAIYDVVEEDEYADLVAKRRDTAGMCLETCQHV